MSDQLNDLKNRWREAKDSRHGQSKDVHEIIALSKKKMKSTVNMHVGNIVILTITLIGIAAFVKYVAPFKETISQIGIALMLGSLILRIAIELYSIYLSSKINMGETTTSTNYSSLLFYQFRKKIHGPITITIVIVYTLGFYMLTPEFSLYFTTNIMILIHASYLVGAVIVAYSIRRAIRTEMDQLSELLSLQDEITNKN